MNGRHEGCRLKAPALRERMRGRWPGLLLSHGVAVPPSPRKHGPCPACGGKDRFRFDDKDGYGSHYCNQCGAGDGFTLLMKALGFTFPEALEAIGSYLGEAPTGVPCCPQRQPVVSVERQRVSPRHREMTDRALQESEPAGDPLRWYLHHRGLGDLADRLPDSIRYHPCHEYWEEDRHGAWHKVGEFPAMLGLVTDVAGNLITLQRTYLTDEGRKAPVLQVKKFMPGAQGVANGCSVKLGQPLETLYLAEGIECVFRRT